MTNYKPLIIGAAVLALWVGGIIAVVIGELLPGRRYVLMSLLIGAGVVAVIGGFAIMGLYAWSVWP